MRMEVTNGTIFLVIGACHFSKRHKVNSIMEGTPQSFERIDRLYVHKMNDNLASKLVPVSAHVLPVVWESDQIPAAERVFPSDHGAVVIDFKWISTDPMSK